ncbi:MAG: hypothetical protein RL616_1711 [Verrucomicrobiota bacterium]
MNFNSIQVRIQLWYGLILLAVLLGLGFAAYELERARVFQQADLKLRERTKLLANTLNGPPRDDGGTDPSQRPVVEWRPPSAENFRLPPREQAMFGSEYFFRIIGGNGQEIAHSENFTSATNSVRLAKIHTPTGEEILVGHQMAAELAELRLHMLKLAGIGGVILFFGLAIGGRLVSRALRPIAEISAAAEKISGGDLSQRINAVETKSELGRLATVLNSTFTRLDAAFTLQKRFAADAAHELRTPVSVLIAQTAAALNRKRSYEENLATIEACHRASQRMRQLITSLLQLARLDAGQENVRRTKFDLLPVASECLELVKPLAEERGVKIILTAANTPIAGDPEQIHQVITNLVTNAIQYNRLGGEVWVNIFAEKQSAVLQVADTGIGISPADLPRIFERFYRAEESRTSGNAGLGLSICKAIIEVHGGTIEVSSKENAGATFTVRLPLQA